MNTQKNILIYAPWGIGIGHINRVCQLFCASFLERYDGTVTLLTDSPERELILSYGLEYEHFEYALEDTLSDITFEQFDRACTRRILDIYQKKSISTVFFDTFFPRFFLEQVYSHSSYLILRDTDTTYLNSISSYLHKFRKIYIPHDLEEIGSGEQEILSRHENIEYIWPVVDPFYTNISENLSTKKQILITPWYGGDFEGAKDFIEYSISITKHLTDYSIVIFTGNNEELYNYFSQNTLHTVSRFSHTTYKSYFSESQVILSRAGYNSSNELLYSGKQWMLFHSKRNHESQLKRAEYFATKSPLIACGTYDQETDIMQIDTLIASTETWYTDYVSSQEVFYQSFIKEHSKKTLCVYKSIFLPQSEYFIYTELQQLKKTFHVVILCLTTRDFQWNTLAHYLLHSCRDVLNPEYPFGVSSEKHQHFLKVMAYTMKRIWVEVCYTEFLFDMLLVYPLKNILGIKLFSAARGNDIYNILPKAKLAQRKWLFESIDQVFTRDSSMLATIRSYWLSESQSRVCRSFLNVDAYRFSTKDFSKLDILIGWRFVEKKRIVQVVELLSEIRKMGILGRIGLIGEWPEWEKIFQKIHELWLQDKVIELWIVPHAAYRETLESYNCYFSYSLAAKNGDDEGVPNVLLENTLSGNLVCTTLTGGLHEIYDTSNACIFTGNPQEDIQTFKEFYESRDLSQCIGGAIANIKREYGYEPSIWILSSYFIN